MKYVIMDCWVVRLNNEDDSVNILSDSHCCGIIQR